MEQWVKMSQLLFTHLPSCMTAVATGRAHTWVREQGCWQWKNNPRIATAMPLPSFALCHPSSCCPSLFPNAQELEQRGKVLLFHSVKQCIGELTLPRGWEEVWIYSNTYMQPLAQVVMSFPSGEGQIPMAWGRKVNREGHCLIFILVQGCVLRRGL